MKKLVLMVGVLSLAGCSDSSESTPDAGDAPDTGFDAEVTMPDAEVPEDVGPPDAGVDSGPPPSCDEEGAMRVASCGACGNAQERCTDGAWQRTSECLNERSCIPGTLEEEDAPLCQTRRRLCLDTCEWGEWDLAGEPGECNPGETGDDGACGPNRITRLTCNEDCFWETECESPCGTLRTSPPELAEVCVPAGPFYRGDPEHGRPFTEVYLSTFASNVHPMTVRRLRECRAARACPTRMLPYQEDQLADFADDVPALANREVATELCLWDGGRLVMTSAQWEKSQRGPVPNRRLWANAEAEYPCDVLPAFGCPGVAEGSLPIPVPVGSVPQSRGYYGTEHQMLTRATVRDNYDLAYEGTPDSLRDPEGPEEGVMGFNVERGTGSRTQFNARIGSRLFSSGVGGGFGAVYCVREFR
jgi:hypothetical protein